MELIAHGLGGVLVAPAGFTQRNGRPAIIALVAGAMLPDIDVVMGLDEVHGFFHFARFPRMTAR